MTKKIFWIMILLCSLYSVSADSFYSSSPLTSNTAATNFQGITLNVTTFNITIGNINKSQTSTATNSLIFTDNWVLLSNVTYSGNVANHPNIQLNAKMFYYIVNHANGAQYTRAYTNPSTDAFPITLNWTTIISSYDNNIPGNSTAYLLEIKNFTYTVLNTTPSSIPSINITFFNTTNLDFNTTFLKLGFFMNINFSINNVSSPSANCTYNATPSMADLFLGLRNVNTSINNANQNITVNFTEHSGVLQDIISFAFCREGTQQNPTDVYVNGNLFFTTTETIPSCNTGSYLSIHNITKNFINNASVNVSLRCPDCSVGQSNRYIPSPFTGRILSVERQATPYLAEQLNYNTTTKLYDRPDHMHSFFSAGLNVVTINCNNTNTSKGMSVTTLQPVVFILSINNNTFVNGTAVEMGNISIQAECNSLGTSSTILNMTFANGTLVSTTTIDTLNIVSTKLSSDGIYNISFYCNNTYGNSSLIKGYFSLNDTTKPKVIWISPLVDNSTTALQNNPFSVDVIAYDIDLFSVSLECFTNFGVRSLNYSISNLTLTSIEIINLTTNLSTLGNHFCNISVKDAHTLNDLSKTPFYVVKDSKNSILASFDSALLNISANVDTLDFEKFKDKYTFIPKTSLKELDYDITCNEILYYREYSRYNAHFICQNLWIDFNMIGKTKKDYTVRRINDHNYHIIIKNIKENDDLVTQSIGVLNEEISQANFTVIGGVEASALIGTSQMLSYIVLILVWTALLFAGIITGMMGGILLMLCGLYGIVLSFMLFPLGSTSIVLIFFGINCVIIFLGVSKIKYN